MTSTNDGKDVKSSQKSGQKGKSYYIELYKSLEARLSGEGDLRERTRALCEAWRCIHTLCLHAASATHPHLITWILRHTAKTILQSEWSKSKDEHASLHSAIEDYVSECSAAVGGGEEKQQWRDQLLQRAQWFQRVLANPWEHPILTVLLNPGGEQPTDEEVLRWLKEERGVMFVTRLRQLAAARLVEEAAALAGAVMRRARAHSPPVPDAEQTDTNTYQPVAGASPSFAETLRLEAGFTEDVWELLTDIEFVLLHKLDRARCIELAKQTPLCDGYKLVERLRSRLETSPREKKLWKNAKDVATLVAQMLVARCMVVPQCSGVARVTLYCCSRSLVRLVSAARLPAETAALAALAATARHLHTFAAAVDAQCEDKKFVCELYVRAITAGMNELERLKLKTEKQAEARAAEQTLAAWFTQLGELLAGSARLRRECALTAFSVHPSPAMYERIRTAPAPATATATATTTAPATKDAQESNEESTSEFGSWANDSRSQTNLVKTSETLNLKQSRQQTNVLSTAALAEGEAIGLAPELCQDLAVLLSGPRVKTLSWDMNREALLVNCQRYMERTHGGTRALTTELKYLNLDPANYQHLPEEDDGETDVYYGIEKGYEHLVEFAPEPEQIWDDRLDPERTETAESEYEEVISGSRTKNKSTRRTLSSDDDSDPLSQVKENKKHEMKKERPHSKERSKEHRRKNKDKYANESLDHSKEGGETMQGHSNEKSKKKKKCKNKKKKDQYMVDPLAIDKETNSNLSNLVGLKVVRIEDKEEKVDKKKVRKKRSKSSNKNPLSVTDSDYDSQGLTSLNSEDTETDVLFDGLFSMEDMKSPERTAVATDKIYNDSVMRNGEFTVSNGEVAINKAPRVTKSDVTQIKNKVKLVESIQVKPVTIGVKKSAAPVTNMKRLFPDFKSTITTNHKHILNDKVKRSITKLLQFRKQKNSVPNKANPITTSTNNSSERMDNIQRSESVKETTTAIPSVISGDGDIIDSNKPESCINTISVIQNSNIASKNDAKPESTSKSTDRNETQSTNLSNNITQLLSSTAKKSPNDRLVKVSDTPHQQHFHNFLEGFHRSTTLIKDKSESGITRKEVKPVSRLISVTTVGTSQQGAKLSPQNNKIESAPNTFARLSYLHKSKQSETKIKASKPPTRSADDRTKEVQQALENQCQNNFKHDNKQIETIMKFNKPVMKSADDLSKDFQKERNSPNLLCYMNKNKEMESTTKTNNPAKKSDELSKNVQQEIKLVNKHSYMNKNNQNETAIEKPMPTTKSAHYLSEDVQQEQTIYNHRSCMHENKQIKTQIKVDRLSTISSDDLSKGIQKVTYLKQQGISVTRVNNNLQNENIAGASHVIQGKFVAASSVTREKHPTLTNILESNSFKTSNLITGVNTPSLDKIPPNQTKSAVKSTYVQTSSLSERDQHDLLLLLRQKNKLISPSQTDITRIPQNFRETALNSKILSTPYTTVFSNKPNISNIIQTDAKNQEIHDNTVLIKNINIHQPLVNCTGYRNRSNVTKTDNLKTESLVDTAVSKTIHENIDHSKRNLKDPTFNDKTDQNNENKEDWRSVMEAILSHKTPSRCQTTNCKSEPPAIAHESKLNADNILTEKDIDKIQVTLHSKTAERSISLEVSDKIRIPESKTIANMPIKTSQQNTTALLDKKSTTTTIMRMLDTAQTHQSKISTQKQRKTIFLETPPEVFNLGKNKSFTPVSLKENPGIQLTGNNVEYQNLLDKSVGPINQLATRTHDNSMTRRKKEQPKIRISSIKNCRSVNAVNTSPLMAPPLVKTQNSSSKSSLQMDIKKRVPETIQKIVDPEKNKPQNNAKPTEAKIENKKNLCAYEIPKEIDPFVSGIQNSDYDLLEELMDDDLRQEIGELSDEEIYPHVPFTLPKDVNKIKNISNNIETSAPLYKSAVASAQKLPTDCQKHVTDHQQILMKPVKQEFLQIPYHTSSRYTANEVSNVEKKGWMVENAENLPLSITDNVNQSHIPIHMSNNSKPNSVPSNLISIVNNGNTNNQTTFFPTNLYVAPIVQHTSLQNVVVIHQGLHMQGSMPSINIMNMNQNSCVELNSTPSTHYIQTTRITVPPVVTTVINNTVTIQTNNNAAQIDSTVCNKVAEDKARPNLKASNIMKQDNLLAPSQNPKFIKDTANIKPTNTATQIKSSGCNKVVKADELAAQTNVKIPKNAKQDNLLTTCRSDRIHTAVTNIASIQADNTANQTVSSECNNVADDVLANRPNLKILKTIPNNLVLNTATSKNINNTDQIDSSGCNKVVVDDVLAARLNVNISKIIKQDNMLTTTQNHRILKDTEKKSRSETKPIQSKDDINCRRFLDNHTIGNSETEDLPHVQDSKKQMHNNESKTKNAKNQERLKNKRLSIINREINKSCFYPPIPLSYTPIKVMKTDSKISNLEGIQVEFNTSNSQNNKIKIDEPTETMRKHLVDQSVNISNTSSNFISNNYRDNNNDLTCNVDLNTSDRLNDYIDVEDPENKSKVRLKRKFSGSEHRESTNIKSIETQQPDQKNTPVIRRRLSKRIIDKNISNSFCTQLQSEENVNNTNVDEKVMQTEESSKDLAVSEECRMLPKPDSLHGMKTDIINLTNRSCSDDFEENKEKQNECSLNSGLEVTDKHGTKTIKNICELPKTQYVSNSKKVSNVEMCKQLSQKCTKNRKNMKIKRSQCGNINPDVKNLSIHNLNEQYVQNNLEKSYTDIDKDNLTAKEMFQTYKKKLSIEELPFVDPANPLKKMIRIKLANGKAYKVTICGKLQDNYDKLFENPHIKSLLYNDFNDDKRYTVNIRQTSTILRDTKKVVKTSIQAINVEKRLTDSIQTVNLISDDEGEVSQSFKTEFGRYIVSSTLDSDTFLKHQKKLSLKCSVKLTNISYDAESQYVTPSGVAKNKCEDTTFSTVLNSYDAESQYVTPSGVAKNKCEDTTFSTVLNGNVNIDKDETLEKRDKKSIKDSVKLTNTQFDVESQNVTPMITSEVVENKCEDTIFSTILNANVNKDKNEKLEKRDKESIKDSVKLRNNPFDVESEYVTPTSEVVENKLEDINFSAVLNPNAIREKDTTLERLKLALIESVVENLEPSNSQIMSVKKSEDKKTIKADFKMSSKAKENVTEVIEIDSSTDSDSSELPILIRKNPLELKSDDKINQLKKMLLEELVVKNEDTKKDISELKPTLETFRKAKLQADNLKQCSVRISKCDDMVKKYEQLKITRRKCFVELTRCDDIYKNDHSIAIFSSCSSTNASDMETDHEGDNIIQIQPLESLDSPHKLTRCGSFSILSDLPVYNDDPILSLPALFENNRNSPVMEAFDNIAASHNVYLKDCLSYENKKNAPIQITDTIKNSMIYDNDECVKNYKAHENQTRNFQNEYDDDHLVVLSKNSSERASILMKSNENQIISISCSSDIFYTKQDIRNSLAYDSPSLKVYHTNENPIENQIHKNEDDVTAVLSNNLCDIAYESELFKSDEKQFHSISCSSEIFSSKHPLTNSIDNDSYLVEDENTYKNEMKYSQIQKDKDDVTVALSNYKCETASVTGFLKFDKIEECSLRDSMVYDSHSVEDYNSYEIKMESEKGENDKTVETHSEKTSDKIVLLGNLSEGTCETKLVNSDDNQIMPLLCSSEIFFTKHAIRDSIVKGRYVFEEYDKEKEIQMKIRNENQDDVTLLSSTLSECEKSEKLDQNKMISISCSADFFFTKHALRDFVICNIQTHMKNLQNVDKCENSVSVVSTLNLCDIHCPSKLVKFDGNETILSSCSSEIFLTKRALREIVVYDSQIEKINITSKLKKISTDENKNLPIQDENNTKIIYRETKSQTLFMVPSLTKITLQYLVNSPVLDILKPLCVFRLSNLPASRKRPRPKRKEAETCINSSVRKKAKICTVELNTDALLPYTFKTASESKTVERNSTSQSEIQELFVMTKNEEIGREKYDLNNKQSTLTIPCDDQNFERKLETINENFKSIKSFQKLDNACADISIENGKNYYSSTLDFNPIDTEIQANSEKKCNIEIKFDLSSFETSLEKSDSKLNVVTPTLVYRNKCLKRKWPIKANDPSIGGCRKRYRKSKNIDCPNLSKAIMKESAYEMEYRSLFNYCSSIKFSYSLPFHKEYIDVHETLKDWPIQNANHDKENLEEANNIDLFSDINYTQNTVVDPLQQTLSEEIATEYEEVQNPTDENKEYNFSMGFGEGSDRVIQNLEELNNVSKFSAATLSDVKQSQPFLLSEDYDNTTNQNIHKKAIQDQVEKIRRHFSYVKLRNKIRNFFRKSALELTQESIREYNKDKYKNEKQLWPKNLQYDLCSLDFVVPAPVESVVQVVQVGQLPVSAAAQNPITCDPRVTHVSDASPSQYSVENSSNDESPTAMKTEYTELTTADLTLPIVQEYDQQKQSAVQSPKANSMPTTDQETSVESEIKSAGKTEVDKDETSTTAPKEEQSISRENNELMSLTNSTINNIDYSYDRNTNNSSEGNQNIQMFSSTEQLQSQQKQNGSSEKTDQIAHAMNAAGITTSTDTSTSSRAHALVNIISQKIRPNNISTTQASSNNYPKATSINAMALQQALAQILPPPLNQTNAQDNSQQTPNTVTPQVLHIVQGKNASGNQITLVDNSQQSVINAPNATQVLHIVQNKSGNAGGVANNTTVQQSNPFSGLSLVDAGLQQGGNQLLHIVNTSNQKNSNAGQLLKRVNLLTNLTNVQGSNEQKMVQFVCKSADGKSIQLNAPQQRSMVLRLQPIETPTTTSKQADNQDASSIPASTASSLPLKETITTQQEIKSRSVYEENYAKFIQSSSNKQPVHEKSTSLPKFNQAFGKPVFQESNQKQNDMNSNSHLSVNTNNENTECQASENAINLDHIGQISSPPLLLRKSPQTSQSQSNLVQHIKQTLAPMNIQTMHGGVIYTRQIPVNIGGGQTINLITVPSTELLDDSGQKQPDLKFVNQGDMEPSIIKIVPQSQPSNNAENSSEESNNNMGSVTADSQNPQPQPVLTQMRIKLPMLSKTPTMVPGARVMRPSFFQIQRNVIGGTNQPVYQQLVLTAAPPLGQQTIRIPQTQTNRPLKVPSENQSESQMSTSTLEQLREFDMVLEQVKERSTVQPNSNSNNTFGKLHTQSTDSTDSSVPASSTVTEATQQVLYSINNQPLNVAYVNRKPAVTPTTSTFVRSPDSSGIADSPTSSTHVQIPHTVTTESSNDANSQPKATKVGSKSKSRPKSSSNPPTSMKINTVPPKTSTQKPLEDEQTTQRILYILAEYKEQVENSPDKDKPAPRRRSNPPSNPSGSSKRKKSSSGSRRPGARDMSPVHGDDTCRTMGSEDSSCGTSQGDCNESCLDSHSPQDSPRKVVRKITFENETPAAQPRPQPPRNVIVADGQTITVARGTAGKPATAVLMPANYILPVSMVKGGQQIAIVTNRGPKLLTVGGGEGGATNALLLQRLIGPAGLKPVLTRPGVRHVRLPTAALHNLQAFNLASAAAGQPPDSGASPAPAPTPDPVDVGAAGSPWADRDAQEVKPERGSSPEATEPWSLQSTADPRDYTYEETRADNMDRTVLDPIPDRYSPDMEAQRIFDKMFEVETKKSYIADASDDSPRCGAYDVDASDCEDKSYHHQKKDGGSQRQGARLTHVSAAALRHKYAILEHELRLQKSLSEECEDLGVDSPSASELFPEVELLFAASPAHDHDHTTQSNPMSQGGIPQPEMDEQAATDRLLARGAQAGPDGHLAPLGGGGGGGGGGDAAAGGGGVQPALALDHEEFARAHPNTTFHSEPTDGEVQPFTISGLKGRHMTSTIFHSSGAPATVLMAAPPATVISQAAPPALKYDMRRMVADPPAPPAPHTHRDHLGLASVLVKDDSLNRYDTILTGSRELHLTDAAAAAAHPAGNAAPVIRRVRDSEPAYLMGEDSSRDATLESAPDDRSTPERHADLFWETGSPGSERSEGRRQLDYSSDSDKCCKSPSGDDTNSTDESSGLGARGRLHSVIKDARRARARSRSAGGSSAEDAPPPLRTYPPKRMYHAGEPEPEPEPEPELEGEGEAERSVSGKTRAGERSPDSAAVRRRASGRGVVKRGCHCCNGSPAPLRPKKPRQRKHNMDFNH